MERHAEAAAAQCLREWRRLPRVVSHAHLPLLRAAQQLMELSEAAQIHTVSPFVASSLEGADIRDTFCIWWQPILSHNDTSSSITCIGGHKYYWQVFNS